MEWNDTRVKWASLNCQACFFGLEKDGIKLRKQNLSDLVLFKIGLPRKRTAKLLMIARRNNVFFIFVFKLKILNLKSQSQNIFDVYSAQLTHIFSYQLFYSHEAFLIKISNNYSLHLNI